MNTKRRPGVGLAVIIEKTINNKKHVLLGLRGDNESIQPKVWAPPGGHLEFGEDLITCALREVKEETGIELTDCNYNGIINDIEPNHHYLTIIMEAQMPEDQEPKNLEPHKCKEWKWFERAEYPKPLFSSFKKYTMGSYIYY